MIPDKLHKLWRTSFQGRAASSVAIVCAPAFYDYSPRDQQSVFLVGHIAEHCSSEQRLCYNCRQPGHESSACPSPRTVSAKQCYSCGGVGHIQGLKTSAIYPTITSQISIQLNALVSGSNKAATKNATYASALLPFW